jgi:copper chaperone CopZ
MHKTFIAIICLAFALTQSIATVAQTTQTPTSAPANKQQTIKLKVTGITCSGDCKDIQKEISKLTGVIACKTIGKPSATSVFEVTFDTTLVTEKEIRSKIEDTPGCEDPKDRPYKVKL